MFEKARYKYRIKCLRASVVLMAVALLLSVIYIIGINAITRDQTYSEMLDVTEESALALEDSLRADRNMLRITSKVIGESEESLHSLKVTQYLNNYDANSAVTDVALLLPNNQVVRISGMDLDATGVLDFKSIDENGEHITALLPDLEVEGVMDIRSFVPIRREGETIAYIYSASTPGRILNGWLPDIYDGHGYISVIDRDSGTYIMDSRDRSGLSIDDLDNEVVRSSLDGPLSETLLKGKKGYAIINDRDLRQKLYLCYLPMNIENWEFVISVPERDVYAAVSPVRKYLHIFLIALALMLIVYFAHILHVTSGSIDGIERRANVDALTHLQNRNRYEYFIERLAQGTDGMACMYFDVNGLHEMNNTQGHTAGDKMLCTIADILRNEYGDSNTYRIGGDEFVTFRYDRDEAAVMEALENVKEKISEAGYHVAVGMSMATPDRKLAVVIKEAETRMYEDKENYYKSIGREMR